MATLALTVLRASGKARAKGRGSAVVALAAAWAVEARVDRVVNVAQWAKADPAAGAGGVAVADAGADAMTGCVLNH